MRRMQFWENYFLHWTYEGQRDSNTKNLVLQIIAEKDRQIAELQAQLRQLQGTTVPASPTKRHNDAVRDEPSSKEKSTSLPTEEVKDRTAKEKKILHQGGADHKANQRSTWAPKTAQGMLRIGERNLEEADKHQSVACAVRICMGSKPIGFFVG